MNAQLGLTIRWCLLLLVASGCQMSRKCSLKIDNQSGHTVHITSGHTGRTVRIPIGGFVILEHAIGSLDITTDDGQSWHYAEISVPDNVQSVDSTSPLGQSKTRLELKLDKEGNLHPLVKGQMKDSVAPIKPTPKPQQPKESGSP